MPLLTPNQQTFQQELKKIDISAPTLRKLLFGEKCQGNIYRKLKGAGIEARDTKWLLEGQGKDRAFDPRDSTEVGRTSGNLNGSQGGKKRQGIPASLENGGIEVTRVRAPAADEVAQFTDEEKQEIRDNYRRTSQGLAPLLADGSRPPATDRPTPGDVEYWAQRAIAIGIAKPRAAIPPPTGENQRRVVPPSIPVPQPDGAPRGRAEVFTEEDEPAPAAESPVNLQKLAGKPRPPPPENLAPIRAAALQRFQKPVEPSSDETGKFLTFNGRVIGMGESWEEAFDAAEMELSSPAVASQGVLTETEPTHAPRPVAAASAGVSVREFAAKGASSDRAIDRLGAMARTASETLGHTLGPWYRPDGQEDSHLVASCKTCNMGVDVMNPATDGGSNVRGKGYTSICQGS